MKYIIDFIEVVHYGKDTTMLKATIYAAIALSPLAIAVWGAFKILEIIQ